MNRFLVGLITGVCLSCLVRADDLADVKQKAEAGDVAAQMQLADVFEKGKGVRRDHFAAFDWYLKAAQNGNSEAQRVVGVKLRTGDGGRKDPEEAVTWFLKAAKQGNADAMFELGTSYYNGDGVLVNDESALAWFVAAQAFGNKEAEDAIKRSLAEAKPIIQASGILKGSQMLINGAEVPQQAEAAIPWLKKLAEAGRPSATVLLAQLYVEGKGVPKNFDLAARYCEEGAKARLPQAMGCLGYLYRKGLGKPADLAESVKWYSKAAKCGEPVSMFVLSEMYAKGEGVKADRVQQYALLRAAARYLPQAQEKAGELSQQLTKKEFDAAQKRPIATDRNCNFDAAMQ